jgi:hypothetical protein
MVSLLPDAEFHTMHGESHLGGLGMSEEILRSLLDIWDAKEAQAPFGPV